MGPQETDRPKGEGQGEAQAIIADEVERIEIEEATERLLLEWVGKKFVDGMSFCDADLKRAALKCAQIVVRIRAESALAVDVVVKCERKRREGP